MINWYVQNNRKTLTLKVECWFDENSSSNLKLVLTGGNYLQSKHEDTARTERVGSCVESEKGTSSFVNKS